MITATKTQNGWNIKPDCTGTLTILSGKYKKTDKGGELVVSLPQQDGLETISWDRSGEKLNKVTETPEFPIVAKILLPADNEFGQAVNVLFASLEELKLPATLADGFKGEVLMGTSKFTKAFIEKDFSKAHIALAGGFVELEAAECKLDFLKGGNGGYGGGSKGQTHLEKINDRLAYLQTLETEAGQTQFTKAYYAALNAVGLVNPDEIATLDPVSLLSAILE
jgi:hypothetical protein